MSSYSPVAPPPSPLSPDAWTRIGQLALRAQVAAQVAQDMAAFAQEAAEMSTDATERAKEAAATLAAEVMAFTGREPLAGA